MLALNYPPLALGRGVSKALYAGCGQPHIFLGP